MLVTICGIHLTSKVKFSGIFKHINCAMEHRRQRSMSEVL